MITETLQFSLETIIILILIGLVTNRIDQLLEQLRYKLTNHHDQHQLPTSLTNINYQHKKELNNIHIKRIVTEIRGILMMLSLTASVGTLIWFLSKLVAVPI